MVEALTTDKKNSEKWGQLKKMYFLNSVLLHEGTHSTVSDRYEYSSN